MWHIFVTDKQTQYVHINVKYNSFSKLEKYVIFKFSFLIIQQMNWKLKIVYGIIFQTMYYYLLFWTYGKWLYNYIVYIVINIKIHYYYLYFTCTNKSYKIVQHYYIYNPLQVTMYSYIMLYLNNSHILLYHNSRIMIFILEQLLVHILTFS